MVACSQTAQPTVYGNLTRAKLQAQPLSAAGIRISILGDQGHVHVPPQKQPILDTPSTLAYADHSRSATNEWTDMRWYPTRAADWECSQALTFIVEFGTEQ